MNKDLSALMNNILIILQRKNSFFVIASIIYILVTLFIKWGLGLEIATLMYALGGFIGMYFMDFAEDFFKLKPSPFRSIVFMAGFVIVSFFIVSSSDSYLAQGLVLLLYLTLILWQIGELKIIGNLNSWYHMISQQVSLSLQKTILGLLIIVYCWETWLFIT